VFADPGWFSPKLAAAFLIGCGSTLQAVTGRMLIARIMGLPLRLTSVRHVFWLLGIGGPINCVIAATVGVGTLFHFGILSRADLASNWLAWWSGDTLGVLVFMPLVLLAPGTRDQLTWRGISIGRLPLASLLLLLLPLGLTFYAWKVATESDYQRGQTKFSAISVASMVGVETETLVEFRPRCRTYLVEPQRAPRPQSRSPTGSTAFVFFVFFVVQEIRIVETSATTPVSKTL